MRVFCTKNAQKRDAFGEKFPRLRDATSSTAAGVP